ncbi:MAG: 6-bladed beta-propeller [Proteiniphilum sp.]|nr:6-bladed beta-propeller [Proteiniphilum sp.]MEA4918102.1 6-bladed beta-propeller [Proteiniphilum sp.]
MKKIFLPIFLIVSLLIIISCVEKQEEKGGIKVGLDDKQKVSLFDIFSKIEIIPLETNDLSLIKTISKIIISNDTLYIRQWNVTNFCF